MSLPYTYWCGIVEQILAKETSAWECVSLKKLRNKGHLLHPTGILQVIAFIYINSNVHRDVVGFIS